MSDIQQYLKLDDEQICSDLIDCTFEYFPTASNIIFYTSIIEGDKKFDNTVMRSCTEYSLWNAISFNMTGSRLLLPAYSQVAIKKHWYSMQDQKIALYLVERLVKVKLV